MQCTFTNMMFSHSAELSFLRCQKVLSALMSSSYCSLLAKYLQPPRCLHNLVFGRVCMAWTLKSRITDVFSFFFFQMIVYQAASIGGLVFWFNCRSQYLQREVYDWNSQEIRYLSMVGEIFKRRWLLLNLPCTYSSTTQERKFQKYLKKPRSVKS